MENETHPFKSISMQQLEEAFASAVKSLTNIEAKVKISMIKDIGDQFTPMTGKEKFELALVVSPGVYYGATADFPVDDNEEIKF